MEIRNRHALITGSNRGIGLAIAEALAARGAYLHLAMRAPEFHLVEHLKLKGAVAVQIHALDMNLAAGIDTFADNFAQAKWPLDILVNNAGLLTGGLLEEQKVNDIYRMLQVNLTGLIHLTARLLPGMIARKSGKIINNASVSGIMHLPCATTYSAAKTGVLAFTESLRVELQGTGVTTLAVITPGVETRMFGEIPAKYGKHMDLSTVTKGMAPEMWAQKIIQAMERDRTALYPSGAIRISLFLAQHFPRLFGKLASTQFSRKS